MEGVWLSTAELFSAVVPYLGPVHGCVSTPICRTVTKPPRLDRVDQPACQDEEHATLRDLSLGVPGRNLKGR